MLRMRLKPLVFIIYVGLMGASSQTRASGFQIFETDGAGFSNYHAGYAAAANDASTDFYNPAGMTRIHSQQLVVGAAGVMPSFKFKGTVDTQVPPFPASHYETTAQGGKFNLVPNLHYVAPINDRMNFGLSFTVPFGLKSDWGGQTDLRYSATLSSVMVFDLSPVLAYKLTDKWSIGGGPDIQRMFVDFNSVASMPIPGTNTETLSINRFSDTAYGYHMGVLYEMTPETRFGASYHSSVTHHLTGKSTFVGFMAGGPGAVVTSNNAWLNIRLPAYTAISMYHRPTPKLALMASVIYTQWNSIQALDLHNLAAVNQSGPIRDLEVKIPQDYRNTYNFSIGMDYDVTDSVQLKAGAGYDQSPVRGAYRTVQMPDNNRYVISFGTHFKASKTVAIDLGYTHVFIKDTKIDHSRQERGAFQVETNGIVGGGADILAGQITWDMF